eukprot:6482845-Amphidinium_carterae.1
MTFSPTTGAEFAKYALLRTGYLKAPVAGTRVMCTEKDAPLDHNPSPPFGRAAPGESPTPPTPG